jgi:hypothetical protein
LPDLEAWERALLESCLKLGAQALAQVLAPIGAGRRDKPVVCACGAPMHSQGLRSKILSTLLGTVEYRRSLFVCPECGASRFPGDELLDVMGTGFSPGVRRLMARAGSRTSFAEAESDLAAYANVRVDRRDIERIAEQVGREVEDWRNRQEAPAPEPIPILYVSFDGTAAPMRRKELAGRKGRQPDGSAKGREVKVGCVFTQTGTNDDGFPVRDKDSTTFVAGLESSTLFGERIYQEAVYRGLDQARAVVVLTDGAAYNKTIAQTHFSNAVHVIDLYHAREHLHSLAVLCRATDQEEKWKDLLDQGAIDPLAATVRPWMPKRGEPRKEALKELNYFRKNERHMQYAQFRRRGFFVGSGVVEAGCRTVVGQRLKQPGMFWSVRGAHAILQLRCCILSSRFDRFWDDRAA